MIYITGDTHREQDIYKINPKDGFEQGKLLTKDDYVIICGDFGCVWDGGKGDDFWLDWLDSLPWTTCFIDGNHENFDILNQYPIEKWHGGKIHRIRDKVIHLMRGEVYDIEGQTFFCFGGGVSHDAQYRTEYKNWWKQELPTQDEVDNARCNLDKRDWKVDVVLSHDVFTQHPYSSKHEVDLSRYSEQYLDIHPILQEFETNLDYQYWFHGHYHKDVLFSSPSQKPCLCLFNQVIPFEKWKEELKHIPVGVEIEIE